MKNYALNKKYTPPKWAIMERFEVKLSDGAEPYMIRWRIIQTPILGVYIHKFNSHDASMLHDHPWSFFSFVLKGGYWERRSYGPNLYHVRWFNAKRANHPHYVEVLDKTPTWTLVIAGRRQREWGFIDRAGNWTKYV